MAWNHIIGQQRAKEIFQRAIIEKRIPHAVLLWGSEGVGKDAMALEFAKTVNCLRPVVIDHEIEACGECASCRQIKEFIHPNVVMMFSLPAPKNAESKGDTLASRMSDEQIDEIKDEIKLKAENPYHRIAIANATQIRIQAVRDAKKSLSMTQQTDGRRVLIVSRADEMTTEASNAFLKTLEEPHDNVSIILTTARHDLILPTILSRCQQIHCSNLTDEDIAEWLCLNKGSSRQDAMVAAAFANGSITSALEFLNEDFRNFRTEVVDTLRSALLKKSYRSKLYGNLEKIIKSKDKKRTEKLLIILLYWFKDAITIQKTGSSNRIINKDLEDVILKFSNNFTGKNIEEIMGLIDKAYGQLKKNVSQQLILINLFLKIRNILIYHV